MIFDYSNQSFYCYSPEEKVSLLEKQVMELIEESCFAAERSDLQMVNNNSFISFSLFGFLWLTLVIYIF